MVNQQPDNRSGKEVLSGVARDLVQRWATFAGVVLSPGVFVLMSATIAFIALSLTAPELGSQPVVAAIITIIISIFSGLVGALISRRWSEITEGGVLVTRGKSAIRGLKLLLMNISSTEQRINAFKSDLDENNDGYEITKHSYEELLERCNSMQEEAINSIEEWQDIIPEADLTTQIGIVSDLKVQKTTLENQITETQHELHETKEQSEEEKSQLQEQLRRTTNDLSDVKRNLRKKETEIGSSVLSSLPATSLRSALDLVGEPKIPTDVHTCSNCGHVFISHDSEKPRCPECEALPKPKP